MEAFIEWLSQPWPWYVAGPLIGLMVPALLLFDNRRFGISGSLRHICAAAIPGQVKFFQYDWRNFGGWNLALVAGSVVGGLMAGFLFSNGVPVEISAATKADIAALGIEHGAELMPASLFGWEQVGTGRGLLFMVVGGFMVGFGTRYAGGCTSGHGIMGMSRPSMSSILAVCGFFIGGLTMVHILYPLIF